jgi:hypothetical protein
LVLKLWFIWLIRVDVRALRVDRELFDLLAKQGSRNKAFLRFMRNWCELVQTGANWCALRKKLVRTGAQYFFY